nr:unnamed protein product [Callosobruchus analis]
MHVWGQIINKNKREKGVTYKGKKKQHDRWSYDMPRPARFMSDPCNCKRGKSIPSKLKCGTITHERRQKIFHSFWTKMTWAEKKMYVKGLVKVENVKRRRGNNEVSRRSLSMTYTLKNGFEEIRVCKNMFTGTLGLKGRTVVEWVKGDMENITTNEITEGPKINRKSLVRQAKSAECDSGLRNFFNDLPKMESHYCRASSKKLYLEPWWASKSSLYNLYKNDYCARNQLESVSNAKFYTTFNDLNLSLFRPKKDECEVCVGYRTKNIPEEVYQLHQKLKDEARMQKSIDKSSCNTSVFTIDLQSVLLSPKTNVSTMYYKTKLVIHNLTIYNLKTKEVYCYLWNEAEGQLSANEFSSIVTYFLETEVIPKLDATREIVIYSDGYTCQNRNAILANALLHVASVHKEVTILQKYLLKGHTQMEVDSVHSCIERVVRNIKINLPADYVEIC